MQADAAGDGRARRPDADVAAGRNRHARIGCRVADVEDVGGVVVPNIPARQTVFCEPKGVVLVVSRIAND